MTASLTRKYSFCASHRLHATTLSEAENARIFGKCNNPYGHGHNYELEVTVHGPVSVETGLLVNLELLDRYVQEQVVCRFAYKNVNVDVPELRNVVPTTENMVILIAGLLRRNWEGYFGVLGPILTRIHIQETGRNGFELLLRDRSKDREWARRQRTLAVS